MKNKLSALSVMVLFILFAFVSVNAQNKVTKTTDKNVKPEIAKVGVSNVTQQDKSTGKISSDKKLEKSKMSKTTNPGGMVVTTKNEKMKMNNNMAKDENGMNTGNKMKMNEHHMMYHNKSANKEKDQIKKNESKDDNKMKEKKQ